MIELQRLIDLGWLNPNNPIDLAALCNTKRYKCEPILRQFGVQLTDEVLISIHRLLLLFVPRHYICWPVREKHLMLGCGRVRGQGQY
jgi:hypothetical protein